MGESMDESAMAAFPKLTEYVFSNTMQEVKRGANLINGDIEAAVKRIKTEPGKDIWLFGGAGLTTSLLNYGLVDEISLAVHPVILGTGKPLFSQIKNRISLKLIETKAYSSGLVSLSYSYSHETS